MALTIGDRNWLVGTVSGSAILRRLYRWETLWQMSTRTRILTQMSGVKKTRRRGYTRLSPKHQVTIPLDAVEQAGSFPGDELRVEIDRAGRIVMSRPQDVDRRLRPCGARGAIHRRLGAR